MLALLAFVLVLLLTLELALGLALLLALGLALLLALGLALLLALGLALLLALLLVLRSRRRLGWRWRWRFTVPEFFCHGFYLCLFLICQCLRKSLNKLNPNEKYAQIPVRWYLAKKPW